MDGAGCHESDIPAIDRQHGAQGGGQQTFGPGYQANVPVKIEKGLYYPSRTKPMLVSITSPIEEIPVCFPALSL
jgi:hypothetical protein